MTSLEEVRPAPGTAAGPHARSPPEPPAPSPLTRTVPAVGVPLRAGGLSPARVHSTGSGSSCSFGPTSATSRARVAVVAAAAETWQRLRPRPAPAR